MAIATETLIILHGLYDVLAHNNDGFVACRFLTIDHKLIQVYDQFRCRRSPILIPCLAVKHGQHVTVTASLNTICVWGWRCVGGDEWVEVSGWWNYECEQTNKQNRTSLTKLAGDEYTS